LEERLKLEQIRNILNVQVSADGVTSGTLSISSNGTYDVTKYKRASINVTSNGFTELCQTNKKIDVDVSAVRNKTFIATADTTTSVEAATTNHTTNGNYGSSWAHVDSKYTPPILSLNGNTLTVTPAKITAYGSAIGCVVKSTDKFLNTIIYYSN